MTPEGAYEIEQSCIVCGKRESVYTYGSWDQVPPGWFASFDFSDSVMYACSWACVAEHERRYDEAHPPKNVVAVGLPGGPETIAEALKQCTASRGDTIVVYARDPLLYPEDSE